SLRRRWLASQAKVGTEREPLQKADAVKFHPSDHALRKELPTIEEKQGALEELADLRESDPLAYAEKRKEWAAKLCTSLAALDHAVKIERDKRADTGVQSQATKLVAIGMGKDVELWRSPAGEGYATVTVDGHQENYRIESTKFEKWLIRDYGRQNP